MKNKLRGGVFLILGICLQLSCIAQKKNEAKTDNVFNAKEVERIERVLAADDMMGRKTFSPGIEKAADFIANEFKAAGLQTLPGASGFRQAFSIVRPKLTKASLIVDGAAVDAKSFSVVTTKASLKINEKSGYRKVVVKAGDNLQNEARKYVRLQENVIVLVDPSFAGMFNNLNRVRTMFEGANSAIFILTASDPATFSLEAEHDLQPQSLSNVVGVLPGKSRKDEYVIFSGHYDHIGTGKPVDGDSIYNGANDDAAGITGVILLAQHFKKLNNNERTIIFAAFTAEEIGGYGSQYFSKQLDPTKVVAMFNLEMIGTESKWGKNSAYITGYEKTDMGAILQKNLEGTDFTFHPDPYPAQQLFYRSDNATLARLGVPAHTISTSKMDIEPNYHKVSDHVETLDLENMTRIISAIALSSRGIVAGKDTPTRVKVEELR